jgi:ribonuclease J
MDIAIPVHGETEHLAQNAMIAARAEIPTQLKGRNGDLFVIKGDNGLYVRPQVTSTGRIPRR